LNGLRDLEADWQAVVMAIITQPPVNQILQLSVYTPSLSQTIPIALVNRVPLISATEAIPA
jgi:hypothetical protein